jgi:hypothetical protein
MATTLRAGKALRPRNDRGDNNDTAPLPKHPSAMTGEALLCTLSRHT